MKRAPLMAMLIGVTILAGCATTTFRPWMLNDISPGMSRESTIAQLGEPQKCVATGEIETLYYTYKETVELDAELRQRSPFDASGETTYTVTLLNGVVTDVTKVKK